jgi:hypothetical protein
MTTIRRIQIWCWWLLVLIQSIYSNATQGKQTKQKKEKKMFVLFYVAQFLSFCNQTLNMSSSSSLSIIFSNSPSSYSSCCNITLVKPSLSDISEQITINILNMSTINSSLKIVDKQMDIIKFYNYVSSNRIYLKSDIIHLPITFSLCQFNNIPSFEILITNISKGIYIEIPLI